VATKKPAEESGGRQSHKSETRISAIADFAGECKQEKKALPLSPQHPLVAHRRQPPWFCGSSSRLSTKSPKI